MEERSFNLLFVAAVGWCVGFVNACTVKSAAVGVVAFVAATGFYVASEILRPRGRKERP